MRRVVVTGIGTVNPLGRDVETSWAALLSGRSAAKKISHFDVSDLPCQIACMVPIEGEGAFSADQFVEPKEQKRIDQFITFGISAADMAIADSGYLAETEEQQNRTGVMIGAGIGGLNGIAEGIEVLLEKGPRRISPFFIPGQLINLVSGQVSIRHSFRGPNHSVVTACSTARMPSVMRRA